MNRKHTTHLLLASLTLIAQWQFAAAQEDDNKPPVHKISAKPAAEPVPALRYQLLPTLLEMKSGNAALLYFRVVRTEVSPSSKSDIQNQEKLVGWLDTPLDKLPRDEVKKILDQYNYRFDQVALAARRDRCDWELPIRDGRAWEILLPEVQGMREFGRMLAVRARLAIAEHRYDDVIRDLKTGFALARHVAEGPTLVNGLVGVAVSNLLLDQVESLMQSPDAPNLYWALMSLPRPMIDLRTSLQYEMQWISFAFPQLNDAAAPGRTADEWQRIIAEIQSTAGGFSGEGKSRWERGLISAAAALKIYPEAKNYLIDQGKSSEEVAAMPVGQVLAIYTRDKYLRLRDDQYKWSFVPYAQRGEGLAQADEAVSRAAREPDLFHFDAILSAIDAASLATLRLDRRIAMLSVIEGLRMHAAAKGSLPESLADIKIAPALADPIIGQPFSYRRSGTTATLTAPDLRGRNPKYDSLNYELKVLP